ncbi:MAG TPA: SUMF1/EgtB/PvdO family nonheme iron enzyme, partial [Saprospiraceae bacterium]|nr:SUMF1/EgtB/PvdO family nonheme iron enzyme [Saprospiraceae bacterium]
SDRLSHLDQLKDALPAILHKRYELRPLSRAQAEEAIVLPATLPEKDGLQFFSPPFAYQPEALGAILDSLSGNDTDGSGGIEAFQLQVICQYVERAVREGHAKHQAEGGHLQVRPEDLPNLSNIYEEYYQQQLALLPEQKREAARLVIEEGLLLAGEEGEDPRRMSVDGRALIAAYKNHGVDEALLDTLVDRFLLRRERNTTGGFSYEISHDTLMRPIAHARQQRREQEKRLAEEAARRQREIELQEAQRQAEKERKLRERAQQRTRLALIISILALLLAFFAGWQYWRAQNQKKAADDARKDAVLKSNLAIQKEAEAQDSARVAKEQRHQADSLALVAFDEKNRAENERQRAENNLARLNTTRLKVVDVLIEQAKALIFECKHEEALAKLQEGASLVGRYPPLGQALMELAFFYGEARQAGKAKDLAITTARLLGKPARGFEGLPDKRFANYQELGRFRTALQSLDKPHYKSAYQRYYPAMIDVQGGSFTMGCDTLRERNCDNDELPPHPVILSTFRLAQTETTIWQYSLYCAATGGDTLQRTKVSTWSLDGNTPIIIVSWHDAARYANWVSRQMGQDTVYQFVRKIDEDNWEVRIRQNIKNAFRLPTEAEWEFAARGGIQRDTSIYSGSNDINEVAWYYKNADRTVQVATLNPNKLEIYDMSGNVWEWCQDWWASYEAESQTDPTGPDSGNYRVLRGGSWSGYPDYARCSNRDRNKPDYRNYDVGFRLARTGGE